LQRKNSLNELVKKIILFKNRSKAWESLWKKKLHS
jgi:hypothetical protein